MDGYDDYGRTPPTSRGGRGDRDDHRSADAFRDRRRSQGQPQASIYRPRGDSPDSDRRRGGDRDRRRSRSPAQIDRYQPDRVPRDDYYGSRGHDDRRERRRSSPPPAQIDRYIPGVSEPTPPPLLINPMPDPMRIEFQVGFTWFAEWWRTEQRIKDEKERQRTGKPPARVRGEREMREEREAERPKIQVAYDQYKEKLQKQQAQSFVRSHKDEDWFKERYVQEVREHFRSKLMDYRKDQFAQFESDLSGALFDDFTLEGIYKSESNGAGGVLEREEGEASAAAEVLGVGDLLPSKGGELKDPAAHEPTLLIKTIAPTVSRDKFEAFAKEYLGEEEGGFRHLSLSDPNPAKKCHRMGWIILHAEPEQEEMSDARAEENEEGEEGEAESKPEKPTTITTSEKALAKINAKTIEDPDRGNFTVHCGVHRPPDAPRKKALWDLFSAPERVARDLELATRLVRKLDNEMGDEYFGVAKIEERVHYLAENGLLQPVNPSGKVKNEQDTNMDEVEDGEEVEAEAEDEDETDDEDLMVRKKKLDLLVEYLRRVYNFCFFCVFESDSVHELQRKCPGGHLRRPKASLTSHAKDVARASAKGETFPLKRSGSKSESGKPDADVLIGEDGMEMAIVDTGSPIDERKGGSTKPGVKNVQQLQRAFNWVKTFEEKILQILAPENVNLRKIGGTPKEEGVEEDLAKVRIEHHGREYDG